MTGTDALISLIRTLEMIEVPYMIVGSYSSNFYGIPRFTKDADFLVNLNQADREKLSQFFRGISNLSSNRVLRWSLPLAGN